MENKKNQKREQSCHLSAELLNAILFHKIIKDKDVYWVL